MKVPPRSGVQTAIDVKDHTRDLPCRGTSQERDGRRDVRKRPISAQWDEVTLEFRIVSIRRVHLGIRRTWLDQIGRDIARSQFLR